MYASSFPEKTLSQVAYFCKCSRTVKAIQLGTFHKPFPPQLTDALAFVSMRAMAKVQKTSSRRVKSPAQLKAKSKKKSSLPAHPPQRGGVEMMDPLVQAQMKLYEEAMALFHQQKFQRAKQELERVMAGPSKELADRARTHIRITEQRMKPTADQNPKTPEDHYQRGVAMMNLGRWDEARESLERARKLAPKADHVHYALAALDCLTGEADSALANLKIAIGIRPANRYHARNDEDFNFLQEDPRFTELLYPEKEGYSG
jgi:tetratricopeptide (TPR) repeat protein